MTDEEVWKKRFWVFALVRIGGLAMVLLGIAIAFTGLLQPGEDLTLSSNAIVLVGVAGRI